ncbi:glycosyl transferase [Vibrio sp. HA2012]|uniref:WecB/TagA/CpsF family glycosyltransferase n=1 Tax=Vibrio sp. HA2012 TaxID=1971595 RepID=UPI000C2CA70E|nr:WecB/TagA/CpsF family glycosyltransferase [Vibrio sp. HA2012]PJC88039.1 glycosyl transferase [Vibrio sp. HA2012]
MNMLDILKSRLSDEKKLTSPEGINTFLNPYSYLLMRNEKELLSEFDHIFIDGQWLCHFLRWFRIAKISRCSFDNSSAAPIVFSNAECNNQSVAIVGSDSESINRFKEYLIETYPELEISFIRNGYFEDESEIEENLNELIQLMPNVVITGMGAIRQEKFLVRLRKKGWSGTGFTCGGFLHQTASKGHKYYPDFVNRFNLRFLYRIWDEPKLIRRYSVDYIKFVVLFFKDVTNLKRKK